MLPAAAAAALRFQRDIFNKLTVRPDSFQVFFYFWKRSGITTFPVISRTTKERCRRGEIGGKRDSHESRSPYKPDLNTKPNPKNWIFRLALLFTICHNPFGPTFTRSGRSKNPKNWF